METKILTYANVNLDDPEERAQYYSQLIALMGERKTAIIAELRRTGRLDENGNLVFKEPLPDDMKPDSLTDFTH